MISIFILLISCNVMSRVQNSFCTKQVSDITVMMSGMSLIEIGFSDANVFAYFGEISQMAGRKSMSKSG